jgi:serine/threonine protein kinase
MPLGTESRTFADGRYELFEPIGSGGMATVYRAHDHRLGVARAVKVLLPSYASKVRVRARFEAEARTMAVLDHPNIVRVYDVGASEETAWIVMELVEGGSLLEKIGEFGIQESDCLTVTAQVLEALAVAHAHGVVHRDIKPHNVLLSKTGVVRITDFGIARCAGLNDDSFTKTGTVMGTWAFMAPEQRVDAKGVDHTADLYGTGATLFTMCTGQTPMDLFAADLAPDMLNRVPEVLVPIIRRATRYNREERYPNAANMLEAVQAALEALATHADTAPLVKPVTAPLVLRPNPVEPTPEVQIITLPSEPTNVTYLGEDLPSTPPVLETPALTSGPEALSATSNLTPLPFRPATLNLPAADAEPSAGPSGLAMAFDVLPKGRTMIGVGLILLLLVGGAVKRVLKDSSPVPPSQSLETAAGIAPTQSSSPPIDQVVTDPTQADEPSEIKKAEAQSTQAAKDTQTKPTPANPVAADKSPGSLGSQTIQEDPTLPPEMVHAPSGVGRMGGTFPIQVRITHLHPLEFRAYTVTAYFRAQGSAAYKRVRLQINGTSWEGSIPIDAQMEGGLEYFVKAKVGSGSNDRLTSLQSGSNSHPHRVRISSP